MGKVISYKKKNSYQFLLDFRGPSARKLPKKNQLQWARTEYHKEEEKWEAYPLCLLPPSGWEENTIKKKNGRSAVMEIFV